MVVKTPGQSSADHPEPATTSALCDEDEDNLTSVIEHSSKSFDLYVSEGILTYLDEAISNYRRAISLSPATVTTEAALHHNLAYGHFMRFQRLGELFDLNQAIENWAQSASLTPDDHPLKFDRTNNTGSLYFQKFELFGDSDALSRSVSYFNVAISLISESHHGFPGILNNLGTAYSTQFEVFNKELDIENGIAHQSRAIALMPAEHPETSGWLRNLGLSYERRFMRQGGLEDLNKAIGCFSQSVLLTPNDNSRAQRLCSLGIAYQRRSQHMGTVSDIDEAISCISLALAIPSKDRNERAGLLNSLGVAYAYRHKLLGGDEVIRKGVESQEEAMRICPVQNSELAAHIASNLGGFYQLRFERSNELEDIDLAIQHTSRAVSLLPDEHPLKYCHTGNAGVSYRFRFGRSQDMSDLNKAISLQAQAISLIPDAHPAKHQLVCNLGDTYYKLYHHKEKDIECLVQALRCYQDGLKLCPPGHVDRADRVLEFARISVEQYCFTGTKSIIDEASKVMNHIAYSQDVPTRVRFRSARMLTTLLSASSTKELVRAWELAMNLLPDVVWHGHTISRRYQAISDIRGIVSSAVFAAIDDKQYQTAIEWFEEGHSIIWKQILQLRVQVEELRAVDPELANKLERISSTLEQAGCVWPLDATLESDSSRLSIENANKQHHALADDWKKLVQRIREKPSFENFLLPKKITELVQAAQSRDIVMICMSSEACGALILQKGSKEVGYLPLREFSQEKALYLHDKLKRILHDCNSRQPVSRKFTNHHANHDGDFRSILQVLWIDVVKPVLGYLGYQQQTDLIDLPCVTWCTTGLLSFFPLHAAGIYPSGEKVFEYVVSSYTPTLGALLPAVSSASKAVKMLAVAQSNTSGHSPLPGTIQELKSVGQSFKSHSVAQLREASATVQAVLSGMETHNWVHLACHASQDSASPDTSAFYLHDGPLKLSTIMSKSMKHAEFAFLSACQTASGDENMPDEAVHLAAGMLMAGYRTVVATMWSIKDEDAPLVAEKLYAYMIHDGQPDSRKAAKALHYAVRELRNKIGENMFASWVPYVHIGV